ncbi:hypothetical protein FB384_004934 [Prauserella sediminis]|uniref:Uncharacterized protein n=1 Tax=Prauserella sediminis TaxID=577680 RepID=A0A839Y242_9PSEU|nr:hypothetical protein [Prauserella sediminis]MBB3665975.1 hypothetical protein [Prauserella sediminis]
MGHEPLRAKYTKPDGRPAVRVEAPRYLSEEQAARMLACLYAGGGTVMTGEMQLRHGLHHAVQMQYQRELPHEPDPNLVDGYKAALERHRAKFFRFAWVENVGKFSSVKRLGLDPEQATHCRIDESVTFDFDEARRALALVYGEMPTGVRVGLSTCTNGLLRAARERVLDSGRQPDPEAVAAFGELLAEHVEGFPGEETS